MVLMSHAFVVIFAFNIVFNDAAAHNCNYNTTPDINLDVPGLIRKYGFPVESHTVQTEDGYLLTLHRIPHGRKRIEQEQNRVMNREPILFFHGILSSSACWIMGDAERAMAYIMADAGYDVWMANARGSTYSRNHTTLNPDARDGKFWDFSWDEIGYYDVPASIDYILKETKHSKLYYIGHSMGTTVFFAGMSVRPEYNDKIKAMFGLGPVATVNHILSPIKFLAPYTKRLEELLDLLGQHEFLPHNRIFVRWTERICELKKYTRLMCMNSIFLLTGFDQSQFNMTWLPVILANNPAGTSVRTVVHYAQEVQSGKFQHYDFGADENRKRYKQKTPPEYNLGNVKAPVTLFWARNDYLADPADVSRLANSLPNVVQDIMVPVPSFNHIDYIWGIDSYRVITRVILKYLPFY